MDVYTEIMLSCSDNIVWVIQVQYITEAPKKNPKQFSDPAIKGAYKKLIYSVWSAWKKAPSACTSKSASSSLAFVKIDDYTAQRKFVKYLGQYKGVFFSWCGKSEVQTKHTACVTAKSWAYLSPSPVLLCWTDVLQAHSVSIPGFPSTSFFIKPSPLLSDVRDWINPVPWHLP